MKVRDLIKVLGDLPHLADAEIGLNVYGHEYGSETDRGTHGPMVIIRDIHDGAVVLATDTGRYTVGLERALRPEAAKYVDLLFVDGDREKGA